MLACDNVCMQTVSEASENSGSVRSGKWSLEEETLLRSMYSTHSILDISLILNRKPNAVRNKCWYLGMEPKTQCWTDEELNELRSVYANAISSADIGLEKLAQRFGRQKSNVSRKARELGLTNPHRRKRPQREPRKRMTLEERSEYLSKAARERIAKNGHPRGFLGYKHTPEALRTISEASKRSWADPNGYHQSELARQRRSDAMAQRMRLGEVLRGEQMYSRAKRGRRVDLDNRFFRSRWEANYARYLKFLQENGKIASWDYECQEFWFEKIKRGTRSYKPDFKVVYKDGSYEWHEVKGWMDAKSKTRLERMKRYFPNEKVVVIDDAWFRSARKQGLPQIIPNWESA